MITVALILLMFDRFFGTTSSPPIGGDPLLWQHLFWIFGHPEVYILILPAFGIVSEILPVFSRKPLFGYPRGFLRSRSSRSSASACGTPHVHHRHGPDRGLVLLVATMLIAVPTGVKIFNWIGTVWGGIQFKTPMYFALGFISMFIIGGLSGVMHSVVAGRLAAA